MNPRTRLADRREQLTEVLDVRGASVTASVGFDYSLPDAPPKEVFLEGAKSGSDRAFELHDAAVVISLALQHGLPASLFAQAVARVPPPGATDDGFAMPSGMGQPASVIGAALDLVARYETNEGRAEECS